MANELHEGIVSGRIREKQREAVAQRDSNDLLGRKDSGTNGAKPRAELTPDDARVEDGEALEKSLGDDTELDVAMVGGEFTADLIAIGVGVPVGVLVAGTAWPRFHGRHPEMIAVGSDGVDRLLERHLDFEAHAVELDNLEGLQRKIRA